MSDFMWVNTKSDNELWHVPSKQIVAQVFPKEVEGSRSWDLHIAWSPNFHLFRRRVAAKSVALAEAKRYAKRHWDGYHWENGWDPAQVRKEIKVIAQKAAEEQAAS